MVELAEHVQAVSTCGGEVDAGALGLVVEVLRRAAVHRDGVLQAVTVCDSTGERVEVCVSDQSTHNPLSSSLPIRNPPEKLT